MPAQTGQGEINAAQNMHETDAQALERTLASTPDHVESRRKLIAYYFLQVRREDRMRHLLWMIGNRPEDPFLGSRGAVVALDPSVGLEEHYRNGRAAWRAAVEKHPANPLVLLHAALAFEADPRESLPLLKRARELDRRNSTIAAQLARVYARVATVALMPRSVHADDWALDSHFVTRTRAELLATNDAEVAGEASRWLLRDRRASSFPQIVEAAQALAARGTPPPVAGKPKRVFAAAPVYPPLAMQARIQGTVKFHAVVGSNGKIAKLELVSGHPLLVAAATEAVQKWEYGITYANGSPVDVAMEESITFRLDPATARPCFPNSARDERSRHEDR